MKILYALQGTGNGHLSRAKEIIPFLQQYAEVDILISGNESELILPFNITYQFHGFGFIFGKDGGIDWWKSLHNLNTKQLVSDIKNLNVKKYHLVISDFEPIAAWAAKLKKTPCISLSHQNAVLHKNAPKPLLFKPERWILKYYAPSKMKFGFHFKTYSSSIFTPIIRREIRIQQVSKKGHYTVYLPSYSDKKLIKILSLIDDVKWQVFSKKTEQTYKFTKNLIIHPIDEKSFIKSIATSNGVLCGAGFETPSEALFLGKKLLVIPMKNQYEQQCNALALKDLGVNIIKKLNKKNIKKIENWIQNAVSIKCDFPDYTEDILTALIKPYFPEEEIDEQLISIS